MKYHPKVSIIIEGHTFSYKLFEALEHVSRTYSQRKAAQELNISHAVLNRRIKEAEEKLIADYGKSWDEMFPLDVYYQVMHLKLFPKGLVHAENLGGEINKISNKRVWVGLFPLRGIELESSMCRVIAIEG